ncbi:MAG: exodeoxyribonuclease III [Gammaproteobacteria bacterium]|nr:exodeoxyribonuclease III [Gammaproteobacteria bacterium]
MRVISVNTNGIRAAGRKGFFQWLSRQRADFCCVQETKAQIHQLDEPLYHPRNHHVYYRDAQKKGYSGVAIYSRHEPRAVVKSLVEASGGNPDWQEFDDEGRYLELQFGNLSIISLYLPSGSSKEERQQAKMRFLDLFLPYLKSLHEHDREYVLCGDWNIAHTTADIRNWKANQKNSGFLPEERAWMDQLFGEAKFVDGFRQLPQKDHEYTWWSNRGRAWDNNVGWRIDYHVTTPGIGSTVTGSRIYRKKRFSDHAPLILDYDFELKV